MPGIQKLFAGVMGVLLFGGILIPHGSEVDAANRPSPFLNIAHRGASGHAPENTFAAFDKAVKMKADFFELDVQRSKDGHLVVIHDITVDRTTNGTGRIADLTLKELKRLDAGSWFGSAFAGERIPTLKEVLDRYGGKGIGILIELKNPERYPGMEAEVALLLAQKNLDKRTSKIIVQSFNHDVMKNYHRLQPTVPAGVLVRYTPEGISDEALREFSAYADYVNPNLRLVNHDLVQRVHQNGMRITPYTIKTKNEAQRMIAAGVDGIITDYPELVTLR
ncbi:glycerophosphodiester phosphodiesterase [Desmospora profundinema]|uniref:Glycerophosphoryl diester phosphodiesterase n=1 Tax=Desmospora profundinema TaxID=1571184 RepID=A0ABU1IKD4_9BACL|nr:glycerophosphodiester phosphodiesterase family protein [Desmospora profundinema]MDR6225218.1 glycerophosphoryl diester phosphodiesterase [Desmospora profundinema]